MTQKYAVSYAYSTSPISKDINNGKGCYYLYDAEKRANIIIPDLNGFVTNPDNFNILEQLDKGSLKAIVIGLTTPLNS